MTCTHSDVLWLTGAACWHALIPAASIPYPAIFTRSISKTCVVVSCTGNGVLWSLLTMCDATMQLSSLLSCRPCACFIMLLVTLNINIWTRGAKVPCQFHGIFALRGEVPKIKSSRVQSSIGTNVLESEVYRIMVHKIPPRSDSGFSSRDRSAVQCRSSTDSKVRRAKSRYSVG